MKEKYPSYSPHHSLASSPFSNLSLVIHTFLLRLHFFPLLFIFYYYFFLLFVLCLLSFFPDILFIFIFPSPNSQVVFFPSFSFCKVPANQHTSRCLGPNPHASPSKSQKLPSSSLSF